MKKINSKFITIIALLLITSITTYASSSIYKIDPKFKGVGVFSEGLAQVSNGSKWGYIDTKGKLVIPYRYDHATAFRYGRAQVKKGDKWTFVDKTGKEYSMFETNTIYGVTHGFIPDVKGYLFRYEKDGKVGIMNTDGKMVIPAKYDHMQLFHDGIVAAYMINKDRTKCKSYELKSFIDENGKEIVPMGFYDDVQDFSEGLAAVNKDGQYAVIDTTGKIVIPFGTYSGIGSFYEGVASARKNGKHGFINRKGEVVVPLIYDSSYWMEDGLATVKKDGKYGVVDKNGKEIVPCQYASVDYVGERFDNIIMVGEGGKDTTYNPSGDPESYDWISISNKKYGYISNTGVKLTDNIYDYAELFYNGFARVAKGGNGGAGNHFKGGKFGFVDMAGKEVVPLIYDYVGKFSSQLVGNTIKGVAPVANGGKGNQRKYKGGKWGYVNEKGKQITELKYGRTYEFVEGYGRVVKDGKFGFVNNEGKQVIPCIYDNAVDFNNGVALVVYNGTGQFIDNKGKKLFKKDFATIRPFTENLARAGVRGKYGYLENPLDSPAKVNMSVEEGTYSKTQTVTLTTETEGAQIYYSVDTIKNYINSFSAYPKFRPYLGPIKLNRSTTITAYAVKDGMKQSEKTTKNYKILQQVSSPKKESESINQ